MNPGRYNERVSVMRPSGPENVGGVPVPGEPTIVRERLGAEVRTASESRMERVFAASVQGVATHTVKTYFPLTWQIRLTDFLVWHNELSGDVTLHIVGVADPDGQRSEIVIAATQGQVP